MCCSWLVHPGRYRVFGFVHARRGRRSASRTVGRGIILPYGWIDEWDSRSVPNGTYILTSLATDTDRHKTTSPGVRFTVHNPGPGR